MPLEGKIEWSAGCLVRLIRSPTKELPSSSNTGMGQKNFLPILLLLHTFARRCSVPVLQRLPASIAASLDVSLCA